MNMNYSRWVNEVRRKLAQSGEPSPELLVARAERDLAGMYMAGETASAAASRLHRYRANPGFGWGILAGVGIMFGLGFLLARSAAAKARATGGATVITYNVPFAAGPIDKWGKERGIAINMQLNAAPWLQALGGLGQNGTLFWTPGEDFLRAVSPTGGTVRDGLSTANYAAWYQAGGNDK